ncbi:MAG TPA: PLP-dependent aminotransferase family protein, partial [Longimicrobium sp.]|nr:PLP-dependent aminotransferase family protein [Longimicrobium sp.]
MTRTATSAAPSAESALAPWARDTRPSALQEMLSLTARPGVLSFALGLPAPELFPRDEVARAATRVLAEEPGSLQYAPPLARLREQVVALMAERGVACAPEQVFLTAGAQQGMSLLARLFLQPGGRVVTERLTYTGFRQVLEPFSPSLAQVDTDPADGMDVDALARLLAHGPRPALIYAMPRGHNPVAAGMSAEKMERLAALAARHGVPVIEDDAYGFLQYGPAMRAPLRALDAEWVCYAGSFSKIMAPGLRQGWLVVPPSLVPRLAIAKEAADIDTATLA